MKNKVFGILVFVALSVLAAPSYVHAAGGGGYVGTGANTASGGGGSGGSNYLRVGTNSWIFYESTGETTGEIVFTPDPSSVLDASASNMNKIKKECSEHTDEGGGFWHYGNDYKGQWISGLGGNFGIYNFVNGFNSINGSSYSTSSGSQGHLFSYNFSGQRASYSNGILDHDLYLNGVKIYEASHYDNPNDSDTDPKTTDNAFIQFKEAWKYYKGSNYTGSNFPNDVWYFCWWPGMADTDKTLTLKPILLDGTSFSKLKNKKKTVDDGKKATIQRRKAPSGYVFLGFKKEKDSTKFIETTDPTKARYVSGTANPPGKVTVKSLTEDTTLYAVYAKKVTLTVKPVDTSCNSLGDDKTSTGSPLVARSVTLNAVTGYDKMYWATNCNRKSTWTSNTDMTYSEKISSDKTIYAIYEKNQFVGRSRVGASGGSLPNIAGGTNGISSGSKNANYECPGDNGCKAQIGHGLKRTAGLSETTYTISRTTNIPGVSSGVFSGYQNKLTTFGRSTSGTNDWQRQRTSGEYTLRAGQFVCEKMTFYGTLVPGAKQAVTQVCATAGGTNGGSGLTIDVKNDDVAAYNSYQDTVYAKPKDNLTYKATYQSDAQSVANDIVPKMAVNGGDTCTSAYDKYNTSTLVKNMLGTCPGGGPWANGFRMIATVNNNTGFMSTPNGANKNYTYAAGNTSEHEEKSTYKVQAIEVGRSLDESAATNTYGGVNTVPKETSWTTRCLSGPAKDASGNVLKDEDGNTITVENCYPTLDVNTSSMSDDTAHTLVPYNFENTTKMTTCNKEDMERYGMSCNDATGSDGSTNDSATMYAGESKSMAFKLITSTRQNNVTDGDYATIVRDALYRVRTCVGARCDSDNWDYVTSDKGITLNGITANYANYEGSTVSHSIPINIPDEPAGTKMCVRSEVYPKDSGDDKNLSTRYYAVGDINSWSVSKPVCFTIAKKPSMQIWGGSIFFQNNVTTSVAAKGHLAGYNNYLIENGGYTTRYFGSWEELGVVAEGSVDGFSSGASLGFYGNNNGNLSPNPSPSLPNGNSSTWGRPNFAGGSTNSSICNRSPLTFANSPCNSGSKVGLIGNSVASKTAKSDKSKLLGKYAYGDEVNVSGDTVQLNNPAFKKNGNVYYYHGNGALTVGDPTADTVVDKNTIQIVHTTSNIYIQGNIIYSDTAASETFATLPKLVIFAEGNNDSHGNIRIDCNVKRIDALIIGHVVNTCADDYGNTPGVNAKERANQLIINGTVVADKLRPSRTYGAATGANSIVPAEIINYDSTLYLWGGNDSESSGDDSTNMDITYQKEVAPRL